MHLLLRLLLVGNAAHAQGSIGRQGMLTCRTAPSLGLIIGSTQKLACQYRDNTGWTQDYIGRMNRIGLDIGFTARGVIAWGVIGSTGAARPGCSRAALSAPVVKSPWVRRRCTYPRRCGFRFAATDNNSAISWGKRQYRFGPGGGSLPVTRPS